MDVLNQESMENEILDDGDWDDESLESSLDEIDLDDETLFGGSDSKIFEDDDEDIFDDNDENSNALDDDDSDSDDDSNAFGDDDSAAFGDDDSNAFGDDDDSGAFGDDDSAAFGDDDSNAFGDDDSATFSDDSGADMQDITDDVVTDSDDTDVDIDADIDEDIDEDIDSVNSNIGDTFSDYDEDSELEAEDTGDDETSSDLSSEDADLDDDIDEDDLEEEIDTNNYNDGTIVDGSELLDDDDTGYQDTESDFISDAGNIVVQDMSDDEENGFGLVYVDINKIAITHRIRKQSLDESLLKSIKSTGLLQPLTVAPTATDGMYVLLDGFRRIQACANAGIRKVPCIVNNKVSTPEIPIIEAMYNIYRDYTTKEKIDCMDDWDKNHGMRNASMIEMLLKLNNGDYTKIQDILTDNDEDIVNKLINGEYDIATAFRKLEQRRKKESAEEKDKKKAEQVYGDESESGIDKVQGVGEEGNDAEAMSSDELASLATSLENIDEQADESSLNDMVEDDKQIDGFEPHKQKVGEREILDPAIRKAALARDNFTCRACKRGGEQYVDILDAHHVIPVYCGGVDSVDNTIMLCVACHRLVHLYATGDLHIPEALLKDGGYESLDDKQKERYENEQIFIDEQKRFKKIVILGSKIRKKAAAMGKSREQFKKEHPNTGIGRRKPGKNAPQEFA